MFGTWPKNGCAKRSVKIENKFSSQNFFQKRICFSILTTYQDRKTNSMVWFLEEVLAGQFVFEIYWPLKKVANDLKINLAPWMFLVFFCRKNGITFCSITQQMSFFLQKDACFSTDQSALTVFSRLPSLSWLMSQLYYKLLYQWCIIKTFIALLILIY